MICASLELFAAAMIGVLLIGAILKDDHPKPFGKSIILLLVGHMLGLFCDSNVGTIATLKLPKGGH